MVVTDQLVASPERRAGARAVPAGGRAAPAGGRAARRCPELAAGVEWAKKGACALADQGLFAGGNFLANVLLARALRPADYGAYSIAFAVFMLFAALHRAILIEPMMVFASGKYAKRFSTYLLRVFSGHLVLVTPASLALLGLALGLAGFYPRAAQPALVGLALGAVAILFFWLVRQSFYVLLRPDRAVIGAAVYSAVLLGSIALLTATGRLSTLTAFLGMAVAGLLTSAAMLLRFNPVWRAARGEPTFGETLRTHWGYGRWAMATSAVAWVPGYCYYAILPASLGLEASGALRALANFPMPALNAMSALSSLLLPLLVRRRREGGERAMRAALWIFLGLFVAGAGVYGVTLWVFRHQAFQLVYGGKYGQYAGWPLLLAALQPAGASAVTVLGSALRALERPDRIFWCSVGSVLGAFIVGIPLAAAYGVGGALAGWLSSQAVTILMMVWFYRAAASCPPAACAGPH
jgi:O-antigen/teichoic acid export membrane protein